jgi:hypothetical protein
VGWWDALFGRTRIAPGKTDPLFQLTTAALDIEARLDSRFAGRAALVVRAVDTAAFDRVEEEIQKILGLAGKDIPVAFQVQADAYDFHWIILQARAVDDVVSGLHMAADVLREAGFADGLLAALFPFASPGRLGRWYLIYSYRRGTFYPFVPTGSRDRDEAREFRLAAVLKSWLTIEKDPERWYALWDPPL